MTLAKFDIRVGLITAISKHPNADSLYVECIDLAEESGPRQVLSGLVKYLPESELLNKKVLVCCNLKAAKMRGLDSFGMLLCADQEEKVALVEPPVDAIVGERIACAGFEYDGLSKDLDGRKADAQVFAEVFGGNDLKTDAEGVACYRGIPLMTSAGPCHSVFSNASIH